MKAEKLKSPFCWKERHILMKDRVWHIPDQFEDFASFSFPGWSHSDFFNRESPVCIEYCSGNGCWIAAKAQEYPEYNWVAVEKKFDRVRKIWSKIKKFNLPNLIAVCGEGLKATHHYFPTASIKEVFINFPDPWPKRRHAKNRIIQDAFIDEMHRILEPEGRLTWVTDDEHFSFHGLQVLLKNPGFLSEYQEPYFINVIPGYGTSYFEDLWREKGKVIRYHAFRKVKEHG